MPTVSFSKLFEPVVLTTTAATLFTLSTTASGILNNGRLRLTNTTGSAVTVTVHTVPSGGAAGDDNAILKAETLGANSHVDIDLPAMKNGDFLQALASAGTSVTAHYLGGAVIA